MALQIASPQSGATRVPAARWVTAGEALENMWQINGIDAIALVADLKFSEAIVGSYLPANYAVLRAVLDRVSQQV